MVMSSVKNLFYFGGRFHARYPLFVISFAIACVALAHYGIFQLEITVS